MKNRKHTLFQLREALEALSKTVASIEKELEYDDGEFVVDISHVYHHLNTAWNARDESEARTTACADDDFNRWRQFPDNLEFSTEP